MIPVGYMAKRVEKKPDWLKAQNVIDIYSVCDCVSKNFADYIKFWKHNGYWFFDSPEIIERVAAENSLELEGTSLFYYEAYEMEFDGERWSYWSPEPSFATNVLPPSNKQLEGFDVVNFTARTSPECSGLACTNLAAELGTNSHCLFASFDKARAKVRLCRISVEGHCPAPKSTVFSEAAEQTFTHARQGAVFCESGFREAIRRDAASWKLRCTGGSSCGAAVSGSAARNANRPSLDTL